MRNVARISALLAGVMLIYKVLGFVEKVVMAARFGLGPSTDAYLAASGAVLLVSMLLTDIAGPALIPYLVEHPQRAGRAVAGLSFWVFLATLLLALVGRMYAPQLARLFGPGFAPETLALAADIIRTGILALPALCLGAIWTAWYQAGDQFARPALADLGLKLGPLAGLLLTNTLHGMVAGLVIGALLRAGVLLRQPLLGRPQLSLVGTRPVFIAAWPLLLTSLISVHLISVIETAIASTIDEGAVSALSYARRIVDVPVMLFPTMIARAVFPQLSTLNLQGNHARLAQLLRRFIRWSMLLLAPLAVMGMALALPIVRLLFERGAFDAAASAPTAAVLVTILPGLPALALSTVLVRFNYAAGDTRWPSLLRALGAVLQIGLALWWRRWGLLGLGWATTVALWIETLALIGAAQRIVRARPGIELRFWVVLGLSTLATLIAVGALRIFWLPPVTVLGLLGYLVVLSLAGLAVYGLGLGLGRVWHPAQVRQRWLELKR